MTYLEDNDWNVLVQSHPWFFGLLYGIPLLFVIGVLIWLLI